MKKVGLFKPEDKAHHLSMMLPAEMVKRLNAAFRAAAAGGSPVPVSVVIRELISESLSRIEASAKKRG